MVLASLVEIQSGNSWNVNISPDAEKNYESNDMTTEILR